MTLGGAEAEAQPRFEVEVEPFYISKFPITNEQFEAYDPGHEPASCSPEPTDPATGISWHEAQGYAEWYAEVSRKPMRLPTETEWEFACRGGSEGRWPWDSDEVEIDQCLWHAGNSGEQLGRLDHKVSNGFGLWGMLGGVWEWTASAHRPYPLAQRAEAPPTAEEPRVLRGGSFRSPLNEISCSRRRFEEPGLRADDVGFRIVKSLR